MLDVSSEIDSENVAIYVSQIMFLGSGNDESPSVCLLVFFFMLLLLFIYFFIRVESIANVAVCKMRRSNGPQGDVIWDNVA